MLVLSPPRTGGTLAIAKRPPGSTPRAATRVLIPGRRAPKRMSAGGGPLDVIHACAGVVDLPLDDIGDGCVAEHLAGGLSGGRPDALGVAAERGLQPLDAL